MLLNSKQVSEYLGVSEKTLANARSTGIGILLPFIKIGSMVRYKKSDLDDYIEANTFNHNGEAETINEK